MKTKKPLKNTMISVRVPIELYNRFTNTAEQLRISNAKLMEESVRAFIELAEKADYKLPCWPPTVKFDDNKTEKK